MKWLFDLIKTSEIKKEATYQEWAVTLHISAMADMTAEDIERLILAAKIDPEIEIIGVQVHPRQ